MNGDGDLQAPGHRLEVAGPSISMSLVKFVLRLGRDKRILRSAERTAVDIEKKQRAGAARRPASIDRGFRTTSTIVAGLPTVSVEPRELDPQARSIVYLPGGAYAYPLLKAHWWLVSALVRDNQTRVRVVFYPLAPKGTARTVIPGVADLVEELSGVEGRPPVLAGDSAGGGLALATAQYLRDHERCLPAQLVLLSPWLDASLTNPDARQAGAADPSLAEAGLLYAARLWADDLSLEDSAVSPLYGDTRGLCPITVVTGTADLLYPDCEKLAAACQQSGTDFSMLVVRGAFHVFIAATSLPEARTARRYVRSRLESIWID